MSIDDYEEAVPPAAATMEALRGIGYSIQTAVADLIDNSISAGATNVWLWFRYAGPGSSVAIVDNGSGMSEKALSEAMQLGSRNPLFERGESDLGRFGLGLKTASLSQCRRLTVWSKSPGSATAVRRWDLDYVLRCNQWRVLRSPAEGSEHHTARLDPMASGTVVVWEQLDQLVGTAPADTDAKLRFLQIADGLRLHLGMVFHRYLAKPRPELRIFINGISEEHEVKAWDPFLEDHPATISEPQEVIPVHGGRVLVQGFVLPHKDRLGADLHRDASGPAGWNAQQGFYVYRSRRLLVPGSWLGLGTTGRPWTREEHYKLARIRVDIPNSLDREWQIDVKKSVARPPALVRSRLLQLAEATRKKAREVFSHRGQYRPRVIQAPLVRAWLQDVRKDATTYKVNRAHPLIAECMNRDLVDRRTVEKAFQIIEATVPVQTIWLDMAERPDSTAKPEHQLSEGVVRTAMLEVFKALQITKGLTPAKAVEELLRAEPFNLYPELARQLGEGTET